MIKPLTSLRFFFAFMIFAHHLTFLSESDSVFLRWLHENVLKEGYIGVSFFFILSGFILAYNYRDSFLNRTITKSDFYIARIARIYPVHLLCLLIAVPMTLQNASVGFSVWITQLFFNITLTQSFIPIKYIYFSFNTPSWSISTELFFYLLFPILIWCIDKLKNHKYKKGFLIVYALIIPLLMLIIPKNYYKALFYINPFLRIFDFFIGILIYELYLKINKHESKINFHILEVLSIIVLLVFFVFHKSIPNVMRFSIYYWIPISLMILAFSFQKGFLSGYLSNNKLILLGEISFGFYMFHKLILYYFGVLNTLYFHIENEYYFIIIIFTLSILMSYFSFIWFEKPLNKYFKSNLKSLVPFKKR